jgi:dTDP-glucose 4,6-dehydratase
MRLLVTGGAGFIGANFISYMFAAYPHYSIINLDKLTYAGNLANLKEIEDSSRYQFVRGDICDPEPLEGLLKSGMDALINFAAESHVDRSIVDPGIFVRTNVLGTQNLLTLARLHNVSRFIQIGTDEVYGSLGPEDYFLETTPLDPSSPYSASKASADLLVLASFRTYQQPVMVTRCSNNYGPHQFPEKLIPLMISNASRDLPLPIYGDGLNIRDWLYVEDHCRAIDLVLHRGEPGEVYNIGGNNERQNLEVSRIILRALHKPDSLLSFVKDRPGHDRRYAIDASKITSKLGWKPQVPFEMGIQDTIRWYQQNLSWVEDIQSGEYLHYYDKKYIESPFIKCPSMHTAAHPSVPQDERLR